jgi:hypothetical protein
MRDPRLPGAARALGLISFGPGVLSRGAIRRGASSGAAVIDNIISIAASANPLLCPASLSRAAIAKGGHPRPDPRERRKLRDRPFRLLGLLRRARLGGGEPAPQNRVLGLQGLDVGFEDTHKC